MDGRCKGEDKGKRPKKATYSLLAGRCFQSEKRRGRSCGWFNGGMFGPQVLTSWEERRKTNGSRSRRMTEWQTKVPCGRCSRSQLFFFSFSFLFNLKREREFFVYPLLSSFCFLSPLDYYLFFNLSHSRIQNTPYFHFPFTNRLQPTLPSTSFLALTHYLDSRTSCLLTLHRHQFTLSFSPTYNSRPTNSHQPLFGNIHQQPQPQLQQLQLQLQLQRIPQQPFPQWLAERFWCVTGVHSHGFFFCFQQALNITAYDVHSTHS